MSEQKHTPDKSLCIEWKGAKDKYGYGRLSINGKWKLAHRIAYENKKGTIPKGLVIDHLCRNRSCVNVEHLEVVTSKENVLRGVGISAKNKIKTHCVNGHELPKSINGKRRCLICSRKRWREYRLREIKNGTWKKS